MVFVSEDISRSTIMNLLAHELRRQNITTTSDSELKYDLLSDAADIIMLELYSNQSLEDIALVIQGYIKDTCHNYPNYFLTGET